MSLFIMTEIPTTQDGPSTGSFMSGHNSSGGNTFQILERLWHGLVWWPPLTHLISILYSYFMHVRLWLFCFSLLSLFFLLVFLLFVPPPPLFHVHVRVLLKLDDVRDRGQATEGAALGGAGAAAEVVGLVVSGGKRYIILSSAHNLWPLLLANRSNQDL